MPVIVALLLVSLLESVVARAQPPPPPEATSASQAPVPYVGKGAEEVAAQLRQLTESLSDSAVFSALEAEVAADAHRAAERWNETGRILKGNLRPAALDSLASSWEALRSELDDVSRRVDARASRRDADVETLTKLRESWTRALDLARKADAPASVLERAQSTLAAIDATRPAIEQRRASVLVLQDSVSRAFQTCDEALARIDDAHHEAIERAFVRQQPPVWRIGLPSLDLRSGGPSLADDLATKVDNVRIYARAYWLRLVLSGLIVLVLMLLLRRAHFQMEGLAERDGALSSAPPGFQTPYAAAILLGLLVTRPLRPNPPFALQQMVLTIAATAAVLVLRPIMEARLAPAVYAFGALFVLNLARELLEMPPGLEQVVLIIEMGATAALLLWAAAKLSELELGSRSPRLRIIGRAFVRILALGCGISAIAAALGYLDLAAFLGVGLFYAFFLAFVLLALRVVVDGLVTMGLSQGPLARLNVVARHRALLERRMRSALDVAAAALWVWLVFGYFDLLGPAGAALRGVLDARLRLGELDIPVARVLGFVAVVSLRHHAPGGDGPRGRRLFENDAAARGTVRAVYPDSLWPASHGLPARARHARLRSDADDRPPERARPRDRLRSPTGHEQLRVGIDPALRTPGPGRRLVQLGDLGGDVLRIGIRSTTVRTPEGAEVIVPNSKMIEEKVTNWTLSDRRRRLELDIGVTGDIDPERIITLLGEVARRDSRVSHTPAPEALLVRFGETSADFKLRIWTDDLDWMRLRSDLAVALQRALRAVRVEDSAASAAGKTAS